MGGQLTAVCLMVRATFAEMDHCVNYVAYSQTLCLEFCLTNQLTFSLIKTANPCWLGNESLFHWTEQYEQFQVLIGTWLGYGLSHLFIFTVAAAVTGSD